MAKLNQIVAVTNGKKSKLDKEITELYHKIKKNELFNGLHRTYYPSNEDGETFPPESKNIQFTTKEAIKAATAAWTELFDVVAIQDWTNCTAKADIVVNEKIIKKDVPVTYLLFLEKQLTNVQTFIKDLPVQDAADVWEWNATTNSYTTAEFRTNKTKKERRAFIQYEATKEHPAQVETYTEDVKIGEWATVKFTGTMPASEKVQLLDRVAELIDAVKSAREVANLTEAREASIGKEIFDHLFAKTEVQVSK